MIKNIQLEFNDDTRKNYDNKDWKLFRNECRSQVFEKVLNRHNTKFNRLMLLGAGNGNDIDIDYFESLYQEIVLVDIDEDALDFLISKTSQPDKFTKHIVDLSGAAEALERFDFVNKTTSQIETFLRKIKLQPNFSLLQSTKYDCIINCNFTSQLITPYIIRNMKNNNISPSNNILIQLDKINSDMIENLFNFIQSVLFDHGILFHSSDMFEISCNTKTEYKSPGFEEFMVILNDNIFDVSPLLKPENMTRVNKYKIIGNYVPKNIFSFESFRFAPWRFSMTDEYVKFYICGIHAFTKQISKRV